MKQIFNKSSLIIVNYGKVDYIISALNSLYYVNDISKYMDEIIIVDNSNENLSENTIKHIVKDKFFFKLIPNNNNKYSSAVNIGVDNAKNNIVIISNNDIIFPHNFNLKLLLEYINKPDVGVVVPQFLNIDGSLQTSYGWFPTFSRTLLEIFMINVFLIKLKESVLRAHFISEKPRKIQYAKGAFLVTKKVVFYKAKKFCEELEFYGEDALFSWEVRKKGFSVIIVPQVKLFHIDGGSSRKLNPLSYEEKLYRAKLKVAEMISNKSLEYQLIRNNIKFGLYFRIIIKFLLYLIKNKKEDLDKANCLIKIKKKIFN